MTKCHRVLNIVPRVPPAVCGVGDYAWELARSLRDEHQMHTDFLAAGISWMRPQTETEFPVFRLPVQSARGLTEFLTARHKDYDTIVLHMSSYGYQKRAVPLWLSSAWRSVARLPMRPKLITMFHELYASGRVTGSAFWLQPFQKWVLRRLIAASDGLRTNREGYANWIKAARGFKQANVVTMPVFSNFGEPATLPTWHERRNAMVMFGWGIHSGESLETVIEKAVRQCRRFGLGELHVIGGGNVTDVPLHDVRLSRYGFMECADISKLLLSCRMAYTAYDPEYFGKSTLMAAFAAHGLAVITQGKREQLAEGLKNRVSVLNENALENSSQKDLPGLDTLAAELRRWYEGHSLAKNADSYANQIRALHEVG